VQVIEVDVIGAEATETVFAGLEDVMTEEPTSLGPSPRRKVVLLEMRR
jgi:hypothetical protein